MSEEPFVWFNDFDQSIVGDNICSKCRKDIAEDDVPLTMFRGRDHEGKKVCEIARFHMSCARELIDAGVIDV